MLAGQDRLKTMPGYDVAQRVARDAPSGSYRAITGVGPEIDQGHAFDYVFDGKRYRFDVASRSASELGAARGARREPGAAGGARGDARAPDRGRQADVDGSSPDGRSRRSTAIATCGSARRRPRARASPPTAASADRIKYGTASWVYGEELEPADGDVVVARQPKIAYYRFDEKQVPDYYLQLDQTKVQDDDRHRGVSEGRRRRIRSSICSSTTSRRRQSIKVDVRDGKPFDDTVVGHYVYHVSWSPDGSELLFYRTNRRQNVLEFAAAEPGDRRVPRHRPRGMADRLGQRPSRAMQFLARRPALHLGVAAQRLEQFLSLRSRRQAHHAAHDEHDVRSRHARQGRRASRA